MTYSVYQHWDPLRVCAVGRSYPPEFYSFITNSRVRDVMERIAIETEEDYQKLIKLLESFGVEIVRPEINPDFSTYLITGKYIPPVMMTPRDYTAMIGDQFFMPSTSLTAESQWNIFKGTDWPKCPRTKNEFNILPNQVKEELSSMFKIKSFSELSRPELQSLTPIESLIKSQGNQIIYDTYTNTAMTTRVGKDLYFGTESYSQDQTALKQKSKELVIEMLKR